MAKKIDIEEIKKDIESKGWLLESTTYSNLKEDLELYCPVGHKNFVSYERFRRGNYECPICKSNKYYKPDNVATKKTGYRILALDQATNTSGWAIFDGTQLVKYGIFTTKGVHSTEKIAEVKYWLASMISKWKPDEIVLEDIQLQMELGGSSVTTYKKLAHLQGVLKNYCYENNIFYRVVPPATWRAHSEIKGKTRADKKKSAQLKVKSYYDISATQDESDAILIGKWGAETKNLNIIIEF